VRPHFESLIIHLQFVSNLELRSSEFLLVLFVSQAVISLGGKVNRLETRLITREVVVLRLQGSVFRSEAELVCHSPPKTIVTFCLTEDRESRSHQVVSEPQVYHQVRIYPRLVVILSLSYKSRKLPHKNIVLVIIFPLSHHPLCHCNIFIFNLLY
jgi:hypothetical protein